MAKKAGRAKKSRFDLTSACDHHGVFLFVLFLIIVIFLMDAFADQKALFPGKGQKQAVQVADVILSKFTVDPDTNSGVALIQKDTLDPKALEEMANMDYSQLKAYLGLGAETDFVIQLQAFDGQVIPIGGKMCLGSEEAKVNGVNCN